MPPTGQCPVQERVAREARVRRAGRGLPMMRPGGAQVGARCAEPAGRTTSRHSPWEHGLLSVHWRSPGATSHQPGAGGYRRVLRRAAVRPAGVRCWCCQCSFVTFPRRVCCLAVERVPPHPERPERAAGLYALPDLRFGVDAIPAFSPDCLDRAFWVAKGPQVGERDFCWRFCDDFSCIRRDGRDMKERRGRGQCRCGRGGAHVVVLP